MICPLSCRTPTRSGRSRPAVPAGGAGQTSATRLAQGEFHITSIHDRMPAILQPRDYDRWLDREEMERLPTDLLRPFESNAMEKYHAHPRVGNVRNQGPEMLGVAMVNSA